jgi:hypothetical protein
MTISKISGKWENSVLALFINNGFAGKKKKNKRKRVLVRREISRKKT